MKKIHYPRIVWGSGRYSGGQALCMSGWGRKLIVDNSWRKVTCKRCRALKTVHDPKEKS